MESGGHDLCRNGACRIATTQRGRRPANAVQPLCARRPVGSEDTMSATRNTLVNAQSPEKAMNWGTFRNGSSRMPSN
jgi:hypothetical protein